MGDLESSYGEEDREWVVEKVLDIYSHLTAVEILGVRMAKKNENGW